MKFFEFIPLSSSLMENSVSHDDVPNIPVPSHLLYSLYSILQILLPKNVGPSIAYLLQEIIAATSAMFFLLTFLPSHLYSKMANTQHAYERDPCLQLLSISSHSPNYISGLVSPYIVPVNPLLAHDTYISLPKLYEHLTCLL